jgi:hypothetical protein
MNPDKLNARVKETNEMTTYSLNVEEVNDFPIKVSMKAIELLSRNIRRESSYFQLSEPLQKFVNDSETTYKQAMEEENPNFKAFTNIYFSYMNGPLYQDAAEMFNHIGRIYKLERYFDNIQPEKNIPQILYKIDKQHGEWDIDVKNINELNTRFSKPVMLQTLVLFKDSLNYEYQVKNKRNDKPYKLSGNLLSSFYNEAKHTHERLESFKEKDYFLTAFFNDAMKTVSSPKEILQFVINAEEVRKMVELDNSATPKPKKKNI